MSGPDIKSYFKSFDSHRLYYQVFKAKKPCAVLLICHGLNEHSGRYAPLVDHFRNAGFTLYLYDHRGHGKSDGSRSHVDHFKTYLKDLAVFSSLVSKEQEGHRIFLIGHSMGGQIVLNYLAQCKNRFAGFVSSSANIRMAVKIPLLKKFIGLNLAHFLPKLKIGNEIDPKWISRDKEVVSAYKKDPYVSKNISVGLASEIIKNQDILPGLAGKISLPALMMHGGDDHICSQRGTIDFYNQLASKDKSLKIYDGFYHELFNETGKEKVFADMEAWLKKHA